MRLVTHRALATLLAVGTTIGCDPAVGVTLHVSPPGPEIADTAGYIGEAIGITTVLATRHALSSSEPGGGGSYLAFFTRRVRNTSPGFGSQTLVLALDRSRDGQLHYHVGEAITVSWSPEGAALRRELEDTLRLRYGELVSVDTVPEMSGKYTGAELVTLALLPFAPPVGFLGLEARPENFTALPNHVLARVGFGLSSSAGSEHVDMATCIRVEALHDWFYSDLEVSRLSATENAWHYTGRVGYLWRPHPSVGTGLVLGYRDGFSGSAAGLGEIGLPLIVYGQRAVLRLEPSYFIGSANFAWNYRVELEFPIHPSLRLGLGYTQRDIPRDGGAQGLPLLLTWLP